MAWIEFHQSLKDHPKLWAACEALKVKRPHLAGHLAFLWTWAVDYAMDGDLTRFTASQIAAAAEWEGDPNTFIRALVTHGFLDNPRQHRPRLAIHDWLDFCGELVKKRVARRAERQTKSAIVRQSLPNPAKMSPTNRTVPTVPTVPQHHAREILGHFNLVCHKTLTLTKDREGLIVRRLAEGRSVEDFKKAITNFSKDDWPDRNKYMDLVYAIGVRNKIDNLDRWLNFTGGSNGIKSSGGYIGAQPVAQKYAALTDNGKDAGENSDS